MPFSDALKMAQDEDLALVEIGANSNPPVCKIMDYGKYRYEQKKKERELKKKQAHVQLKELTMGPSIEQHDYSVKLKKAISFLSEKNRVRLTIRFRGRQIMYKDKGEAILKRFQEDLKEFASFDQGLTFEGRKLTLLAQPKKN